MVNKRFVCVEEGQITDNTKGRRLNHMDLTNTDWTIITVYHESFKAEKFRGKLYMQTFAKKCLWNPSYLLLNPYMNSAILNFHIK